ncbi:hypothetical protein FZT77_22555 [Salmonella enterica subsp. enterica]|nr:hypothetical protein [Salmonella enterica subsp. enterica serovar Enteritidis]ECQ6652220.1 hypothetical protein [Salmonella enterica subsp. enterica serovar Enteritidis]EEE8453551.1 hypothetical protein [Salmonella enterica subsp. enterica serovar Enteritidis]
MIIIKQYLIEEFEKLVKDFGFNPFEGSVIFKRPFIISLVLIILVVAFNSLNIQIAFVNELVNGLGFGSAIVVSYYVASRFLLLPFQILFVLLYIVEIILWEEK